ncbi:MAG: aldo/keto reductase [Methylobacteriaceae bacterium]|jgi:aryl-alcohol dehydrogenase-like predicted oxidoreductase|nr:aldo/keto reductase [Methylobacteriaceae bacterium]
MKRVPLGNTGIDVSIIGMGGHEYMADGRSRGFNEDRVKSLTPGYIFPDFGGEQRLKVLKTAYDNGINLFDVTQDSEKEALGRNLRNNPPPYEVYIQTRPEQMAYGYDKFNLRLANLELLRAEVQRINTLMGIERLDFLNVPPLKWAFDHDPDYLDKIGYNIAALKKEGLIRFASADTFSGTEIYRRMIESGHFDVIYINFNFGDYTPGDVIIPLAAEKGMGVIIREVFMKGDLFKMTAEAGVDSAAAAAAAVRWAVSRNGVSTAFYGTGKVNHLLDVCKAVETGFSPEDDALLDKIRRTPMFKTYENRRIDEFKGLVERMDLLFVPDHLRTY